ncbi:alpha/beta hydrolase [Aureimonas populi]|uniref:Alpha/beta hydrolase n=1 Tax=Aureimonas populi TaxID=1701758 RepID=A0ABW5CM80_9HYPH|nr:alpha/beta hydrolase [Aureimonas populi]
MDGPALDSTHRYEPGEAGWTPLLLLHGTGGDENDLLPLGRMVAPGAPLLSPRGKVLEGGMPRFFSRLAEGVFDEAEVAARADELADFIEAARDRYGLASPVALGFSNGANIAAAILYRRPRVLAGAILIRAMVTLEAAPREPLDGRPVLVLSGASDPLIPAENAGRLADALERAGGRVSHRTLPAGHGLTQGDVATARDFLAAEFPN